MAKPKTVLKDAESGRFTTKAAEEAHPERVYRQTTAPDAPAEVWVVASHPLRVFASEGAAKREAEARSQGGYYEKPQRCEVEG